MPPQEKRKKKQKREKKKTPLSRQLATQSPTLLQLSSAEKRENLATDKFPTPLHSRRQLISFRFQLPSNSPAMCLLRV
jgi:hypothetical protein